MIKSEHDILWCCIQKLLYTPYKWGGKNALQGLDCSQLIIELLSSIGIAPDIDMNSQMLMEYYSNNGQIVDIPKFGSLLFFGSDENSIKHVAFAVSHKYMFEAYGSRDVEDMLDAVNQSAYARFNPINRRSDLVRIVHPKGISSV